MAILFTPGGEYLQTAGAFPEPTVATISFWFFSIAIGGSQRIIGSDTEWEVRLSGTSLLHEFRGTGPVTSGTTFASSVTYHIACTYDGTNKGIYVNGTPSPAPAPSGHVANGTDTQLAIGSSTWNLTQGLNGAMEDVRIYNRVLSQKEIQSINDGFGRDNIHNGLIHWWTLSSGSDGSVVTFEPDIVGKQNMTIANGTPTYIKGLPHTYLG